MKILALLLCLVGTANAETRVAGSYRDFSGGLNNYSAPMALAANESPDLSNVVIDEIGQLTQRNGYLSCGVIPGGATATNLYEYAKNDGSRNLIVTDNVSIWQTGDCVTYSTVTTGLSSTAFPRFATALDKLWIVNGSTWPLVWDGSTLTVLDGLNGKPEGFKAKYITYWKSRIWLANTPTAPSSVYFTSLTSSTGAIIAPDVSTQAWSALNQIYIARDDGSPLYGIKVYRDNLYAFKETGVSRIVFESDYNLSVQKNVTSIGSKFQESIVEMDDGLLRYVGRDGVYAFDGVSVRRLSSKWYPTFQTIKQPSRQELYRLWDSESNFEDAKFSYISSSQSVGSLEINWEDFGDGDLSQYLTWTTPTSASACSIIGPGGLSDTNFMACDYSTNKVMFTTSTKITGDFTFRYYQGTFSFISTATTRNTGYWFIGGALPGIYFSPASVSVCNSSSPMTTGWHNVTINRQSGGQFSLYIDGWLACSGTNNTVTSSNWMVNGGYIDDIQWKFPRTSGTYTSEITTATGVSSWKTFEAEETLNGQTISYDIRTGNSVAETLLRPWVSISPGANVSTTTHVYAQWRANFSTTDNGVTPLLDSASLGWITGDSSRSALSAINYQSRYWMTASTSLANDYNDLVMVESKSPIMSYTRYNLPISAFTIWNNNLYGAISNTAKIARLDYGSTDDGNAIVSYWQSRDENYENPIFYKTVNMSVLDYANNPANTGVSIGLSNDEGSTWEDRTVNLGASTLSRNTAKLNYTPETALGFRTRIFNDTLGLGYKIYGIHNFGTMTNFFGN